MIKKLYWWLICFFTDYEINRAVQIDFPPGMPADKLKEILKDCKN